jgi:signal transduction histidine kinase
MSEVDLSEEALAVVVHELSHPLASIAGWAELLRTGKLTDAQKQRAFETIARSAGTQRRLLDDLLDHARISRGQMRLERARLNVAALAADAAEGMLPIADARGVTLDWPASDSPSVHVQGDAHRLLQVLSNLIGNAIRHSRSGSRVAVEVERVAGDAFVRVRDWGSGIAAHHLRRVFERYWRGVASGSRGLGLGLTISREIVELHLGTLEAHSDGEGRGATFTIRLPVSPP